MIRTIRVVRARRAGATVAVSAALLVAMACGGSAPDADADSAQASPGTAASDKYVPEGDEGLGASIAIVIDNSGSMKDEAEGDDRPKYIVAREAIEAMLASTDSFAVRQPDFPINVGLYWFSTKVTPGAQRKRSRVRQPALSMAPWWVSRATRRP